MEAEKTNQAQKDKDAVQEAVYLVDRAVLLHLKEVQGGDYEYVVFDKLTKEKMSEGRINEDDVLDGIDPTHDHLAAARDAAVEAAGLDGIEIGQVGLTSLMDFPTSDLYRRSVWEPETLPKTDIRFITSRYDELFRISDGGRIEIEYPDRTVSAKCKYLDDYHAYIGSEVYHICQFAEVLERSGGVCRPEPILEAEHAAWKIGWRASLAVECSGGNWSYHLFDDKMAEVKSGELEVVGFSINEVRDMILAENKMGMRSMTPTDYGLLMEKAAQARQESIDHNTASVQKSSIRMAHCERITTLDDFAAIKDPVTSRCSSIEGKLYSYQVAGKKSLYLAVSSMPEAMMGKNSDLIILPDLVAGKPLVPVTLRSDEANGTRIMGLENGSFSQGKEMNEDYQIIAKICVGPVEYALGEMDHKIPFFVTWERTPANDGDGPPNYYWGHYFDNRDKAIQDFCDRAEEKFKMLSQDRKPSIKAQLAAKSVPGDKPVAKAKDREAR